MQTSKLTLLIEVGTEEIPAQYLLLTEKLFAVAILQLLTNQGFAIKNEQLKSFSTPRRIAVVVNNIASQTESTTKIRTGPLVEKVFKDGKPTAAAIGFAKGAGKTVEQLQKVQTPKGEVIAVEVTTEGKTLKNILTENFALLLEKLPLAKRMRWGNSDKTFIRPIHWLCCLLDNEIIPIQAFDITAKHLSYGHRFLAPEAIAIKHADQYEDTLEKQGKIIVDFQKRMRLIVKLLNEKIATLNCSLAANQALIQEVTALVEYPSCMLGKFSKHFLDIPKEALISAITHHQKCFPLQSSNGKLLNNFLLISNMPHTSQNTILKGNQRVMAARLADALFFYEEDKKVKLKTRLEQLKAVIFQQKLGNLFEKSNRVANLSKNIAKTFKQPEKFAYAAGLYCKADLTTDMVGEFPELQGIIGYYLSLQENHDQNIALAIKESYLPQGPYTPVPSSKLGAIVSIADKLDTLVGYFAIGVTFKGDKDPFGLRRQALGLLRILIEHKFSIDVMELIKLSNKEYQELNITLGDPQPLLIFLFERLRHLYIQKGFDARIAHAVISKFPTNPYDFHLRMVAVQSFIEQPEAKELAELNKRVRNILSKQDVLNGKEVTIKLELLEKDAEISLNKVLTDKQKELDSLYTEKNYPEFLKSIATLKSPIDDFFENVMVMVEDKTIQHNRLALLHKLEHMLSKTADISKLL